MAASGDAVIGDLICRAPAQISLISICFPRSRGVPCVDDRRIIGGTLNHVEPHFVKACNCIASINWHEEPCDRDAVLPKRWIAGKSPGWISRNRRLSRDYQRHARKAAASVRIAMIRALLRRLAASPSTGIQTFRDGSDTIAVRQSNADYTLIVTVLDALGFEITVWPKMRRQKTRYQTFRSLANRERLRRFASPPLRGAGRDRA